MYCMSVVMMLRARSANTLRAASISRVSPDCTQEKMKGSSSGHVLSTSGILPASSDSVSQTCAAPWRALRHAHSTRADTQQDTHVCDGQPESIDSTCCCQHD